VDRTENGPHTPALWEELYPSKANFGIKDYEALLEDDCKDFELVGGMFIEANAL
jgi:hypothetical protein